MAIPISTLFRLGLVCFLFVRCSQANSFKPNCTMPPPGTNYVSCPNMRGTIAILWNCLSIIILCTWSIQHLNVPASRRRADNMMQKAWWAILDSTKIKWMVLTAFAPEYLLGKAISERLGAKSGMNSMLHLIQDATARGAYARGAHAEWGEVHVYMANMGHFVLDTEDLAFTEGGEAGEIETSTNRLSEMPAESAKTDPPFKKNLNEALKNQLPGSARINASRFGHRYWALNNCQLFHAIDFEIADLPRVSGRQLEKLDRGEILVKALALIQVTYLIVELVARKVVDLPSTQLEIGALAFSALSMITYILYWNRPQGVESVHIVKARGRLSSEEKKELARRGPRYLWLYYRTRSGPDKELELDLAPIPNDSSHVLLNALPCSWMGWMNNAIGHNQQIFILTISAALGGTLFGGLHCLAWNFHFPTSGEALAWRICSVITSVLPLLSTVPLSMWTASDPWTEGPKVSPATRFTTGWILIVIFLVPYGLARLFLMVEMFRTLFFLPPKAFVNTWSGNFPHLG